MRESNSIRNFKLREKENATCALVRKCGYYGLEKAKNKLYGNHKLEDVDFEDIVERRCENAN